MVKDTQRTLWMIALSVIVPALAIGLPLFNEESRAAQPSTTVATSCSRFEADAQKLFAKGNAVVLRGAFAPGDHVHLAIDFKGVGYSWALTGVIAKAPEVTGPGLWVTDTTSTTTTDPNASTVITSTEAHGDISGFERWELDIDVPMTGDGAITIDKTGILPRFARPRIVSASCNASTGPTV